MAKSSNTGASKRRLDLGTAGGLLLGLGGVLGGLLLEGGKVQDVTQVSAAIIVLGGTIGAVLLTTPTRTFLRAVKKLPAILFDTTQEPDELIEEIIVLASKARMEGIVSLEQSAEAVADPFLRKALNLAVDGADLTQLRQIMELEISQEEHRGEADAKVYEAAGGYAPTIGIIGAVIGLIQVMKNLSNIDEVGHGIAVAFVATVYGVASANLFFLPAASKLKARVHGAVCGRELMLEGVISIVEGMNPKLIRSKLEAYLEDRSNGAKAASGRRAARVAAAES